eukprot:1188005-Prorocentrum_minimum.AAC.4
MGRRVRGYLSWLLPTCSHTMVATGLVRPGAHHGCKPVEVIPGLYTAHFHDIEDRATLTGVSPKITVVFNSAPLDCPTRTHLSPPVKRSRFAHTECVAGACAGDTTNHKP